MRLLHGPRKRLLAAQTIRLPVVVEALLRPRPDDDLHLLGEEREALPGVRKREAVCFVLALVPARAHPDLDAAAGDVVDRDGHPREHARMPERHGRHHRAEPDALGDRGQAGQRRPRVVRVRIGPDDRRVVIRPEEAVEPVLLAEPGEPDPVLPGHALLPLDHQADLHADSTSSGRVTGARQAKRSQT